MAVNISFQPHHAHQCGFQMQQTDVFSKNKQQLVQHQMTNKVNSSI